MSIISRATLVRNGASIALIGLVLQATRAFAAPVMLCVDNDTSFTAAVANANFVPTTIELVQGTYHGSHSGHR